MLETRVRSFTTKKNALITLGALWLTMALVIGAYQLTTPEGIQITWETETEYATAGFNIYRSDRLDSDYFRVNEILIPSGDNLVTGGSYVFIDKDVVAGHTYYYRLQEVELNGSEASYDPIKHVADRFPWWLWIIAIISCSIGILLIGAGFKTDGEKV